MTNSSTRTFSPRTPSLAEREIQRLADLAGAVVQPVVDDQNGWDCLVEFPPAISSLPADLRPPGLTFLIQVKSSEKATKTCKLTLSNALKFARHPLACFVVLVTFENGPSQPSIYFRHVWGDLLSDILQAARKADIKGRPLNKSEVSVRFTKDDRADEKSVERMAQILDEFGEKYATAKQEYIDKVGYEEKYGVGTLSLANGVETETFVDLALGLVEEVEISQFTYKDARFGIPEKTPSIDLKEGKISIEPIPHSRCSVTFRNADSSAEISLEGDLFAPGIPGLPREFWKLRIKTEILDIVLKPDGISQLSGSLSTTDPLPFETIRKASAVWSWGMTETINLLILSDGRVLTQGTASMNPTESGHLWAKLHDSLETLATLSPPERRPKDLKFSILSLVENMKTLQEFCSIISGETLKVGFNIDNTPQVSDVTHYRSPYHLELFNFVFFAIIDRPVQNASKILDRIELSLGPPTLLRGAILIGQADDHRAYILSEMQTLSEPEGRITMSYTPPIESDPAA